MYRQLVSERDLVCVEFYLKKYPTCVNPGQKLYVCKFSPKSIHYLFLRERGTTETFGFIKVFVTIYNRFWRSIYIFLFMVRSFVVVGMSSPSLLRTNDFMYILNDVNEGISSSELPPIQPTNWHVIDWRKKRASS